MHVDVSTTSTSNFLTGFNFTRSTQIQFATSSNECPLIGGNDLHLTGFPSTPHLSSPILASSLPSFLLITSSSCLPGIHLHHPWDPSKEGWSSLLHSSCLLLRFPLPHYLPRYTPFLITPVVLNESFVLGGSPIQFISICRWCVNFSLTRANCWASTDELRIYVLCKQLLLSPFL